MANIDDETLKRNRKFALLLGGSANVIFLLAIFLVIRISPEHIYVVMIPTTVIIAVLMYIISRERKKAIDAKRQNQI